MFDIYRAVVALVAQVTDVPVEDISAGLRFIELDNWTSFTALRLLTAVEDRLGVRIDLREYLAANEVGELVAIVDAARDQRLAA
jgi:acyl carrier protein